MKTVGRLLAIAALACASTLITAQTVYRCGTDGRTYSQSACAEGRPVDAADPRTTEQRMAAERSAAREKALADNLERHRKAEEASRRTATAPASFKAPATATPTAEPAVRHPRHYRRRPAR